MLVGCSYREVELVEKCTKIVKTVLLSPRLLGFIEFPAEEYIILKDGRKIRQERYNGFSRWGLDEKLQYCEKITVPKK